MYCLERQPIVVGKPEKAMMDCILEACVPSPIGDSEDLRSLHVYRNSLDKSRTLMIGDRLDTDILFGTNGGISTMLVLTGASFPL